MIEIPNKVKLLSDEKVKELIETSKGNTELFHSLCLRTNLFLQGFPLDLYFLLKFDDYLINIGHILR